MTVQALYVFAIAAGDQEDLAGMKGIEGEPVYTARHERLVAVVQQCEARPFVASDQELFASWLLTHQAIVEAAWEQYGDVIPCGFNTIVVPSDGFSALQQLREWLERESDNLLCKLERLRGKAEYGVQIIWDPTVIALQIKKSDREINWLGAEILSKPAGAAYMLEKRLEERVRKLSESTADTYFRSFYRSIRGSVEDVRIERVRREAPPRHMLLNLSCLQAKGQTTALGTVLQGIAATKGFSVRFTGPWPPYSFVSG